MITLTINRESVRIKIDGNEKESWILKKDEFGNPVVVKK